MSRDDILDQDKIVRIKNLLQFHPKGLTISDISQRLKLSRISVSKYLDILLISGQVEMRSFGAAKAYFLSSRVPISAMLSFSSDYILILDSSFRILQINDAFLEFLGTERTHLVGTSFPGEHFSFLKSLPLLEVLESTSEKTEYSTAISTSKDGTTFYFRAKVLPTVFDNGSQGLTIILEDITLKHQAQRTQALLASIVSSSDDAIFAKDLNGIVLSWNRAAERIYGYTEEEILGQSITLLVPEDQQEDFSCILERIISGERIPHYEAVRVQKGGQRIDVELSYSPIRDEEGNIIAISTIARDVTEINQLRDAVRINRRKLREIIEFLPDPTFILDRNKKVLGWNKPLEEFTGIKREDIIGKDLLDFDPQLGKYKPLLIDILDRTPQELEARYSTIHRIGDTVSREIYSPKKQSYLLIRAFPLHDSDGSFIGAIESIRDLSDWRVVKESIKQAHQKMGAETHKLVQSLLKEERETAAGTYADIFQFAHLMGKAWDATGAKILLCNPTGSLLFVSASMATSLHLNDSKQVLGSNLLDHLQEASVTEFQALVGGTRSDPVTLIWESSNSPTVRTEIQLSLLQENGVVLGCVGRIV